jgi:hypothetical protein
MRTRDLVIGILLGICLVCALGAAGQYVPFTEVRYVTMTTSDNQVVIVDQHAATARVVKYERTQTPLKVGAGEGE